jgi:hypothetical protein
VEHGHEKYFGVWLYPNENMGVKGVTIAISTEREK